MSTSRRSRAMPTDGPTPRFLYTIIKQLDLKSIDWNLVASQLEISNGHAARMRYSRFRQVMEGIVSTPRASRAKKTPKKSKTGSCKADMQSETNIAQPKSEVKQEPGLQLYPPNPFIKPDPYGQRIPSLADIPQATPQMLPNSSLQMSIMSYPPVTVAPSDLRMYAPATGFPGPSPMGYEQQQPSPQQGWTPVKAEPENREGISDLLVKVEKTEEPGISAQYDEVEYQGTAVVGVDGGLGESRK